MDEITAEFNTEEIKQEAKQLPTRIKNWIPLAIGLITLIVMATIAFVFWLPS
jgi:hypothetical protein